MTDCAMPGIGEVEALERLPARKVLIITGFPSDAASLIGVLVSPCWPSYSGGPHCSQRKFIIRSRGDDPADTTRLNGDCGTIDQRMSPIPGRLRWRNPATSPFPGRKGVPRIPDNSPHRRSVTSPRQSSLSVGSKEPGKASCHAASGSDPVPPRSAASNRCPVL
jgi:hypothetical protein